MTRNKTSGGTGGPKGASPAGAALSAGRKKIIREYLLEPSGDAVVPGFEFAHAHLVDRFFRSRLEEVAASGKASSPKKTNFALAAVGGYGRAELCPHSDIDILIVSPKSIPSEALDIAQPLFLPLWDLGYDLGHGFRTIKDCVSLANRDFQVLASLLDLRFLGGDESVFRCLQEQLEKKTFAKKKERFLDWLQEQVKVRREMFGEASALIEPQLKNGLGGLRDYHAMLWLARLATGPGEPGPDGAPGPLRNLAASGLITREELDGLWTNVRFILRTRSYLHELTGRKNDDLYLDFQPRIAELSGFESISGEPAVERFLAELHRAMGYIREMNQALWKHMRHGNGGKVHEASPPDVGPGIMVHEEELDFTQAAPVRDDPMVFLRIFEQSARLGIPLSWQAKRRIRRHLKEASQAFAEPARAREAYGRFCAILLGGRARDTLVAMQDSGFLGAFIPELGLVQDRIQFDAYHTYPVGRHTITVLQHLEDLGRNTGDKEAGPVFERLVAGLEDKLPLYLGALFHDIGKGGPDHELLGADIAARVMERWGLDGKGRDAALVGDVLFLIRHHLLLVETAMHRDLSDESVVVNCAARINTRKRLNMLYLLTYADSRGTGPKAWNDWSARLLSELYAKALHVIEWGALTAPHVAENMMRKRDKLRAMAARGVQGEDGAVVTPQAVEEALDAMPPRYLQAVSLEDVFRHLRLARELDEAVAAEKLRLSASRAHLGISALSARNDPESSIWEVTFAARDQPGLFAAMAGVLSLHGVDIFSADVFVWRGGLVVAVFLVSDPPDTLFAEEVWARVKRSLKFSLTGKLSLEYRLSDKRDSVLTGSSGASPAPVRVNVDNTITDFYTVIEVLARDQPGLLYEIAHTIDALDLDVHLAKVGTRGDEVLDYFYVRDRFGGQLLDPERIEKLRDALHYRLSP